MPLNALTASVTTGIQGRRFATAISGQTAGSTIDISADGAPGFSFVNGILSSASLPYPVSTAVLRETLAGEVVRETRIAITAVTREQLAAQAAASVGGGRSVRSMRTAATRQADGSLVYALLVEDDLGATASLTPGGPTPTLTLTGPLSFTAGAASGTLVANIGNVPNGSTPTLTPGDGRLVIAGDQASGWKVVVGSTASSAGTIALSVAAPGANGASATVTVSAGVVTPTANWRLPISSAYDSGTDATFVTALVNSGTVKNIPRRTAAIAASTTVDISVKVDAVAAPGGIVFVDWIQNGTGVVQVTAFESTDSTDGSAGSGTWSNNAFAPFKPSGDPNGDGFANRGQLVRLAAGPARWVRVRFVTPASTTAQPYLSAFQLQADGRHDLSAMIGMSIIAQQFTSLQMRALIQQVIPGSDPIVLTLARSGANQTAIYNEQVVPLRDDARFQLVAGTPGGLIPHFHVDSWINDIAYAGTRPYNGSTDIRTGFEQIRSTLAAIGTVWTRNVSYGFFTSGDTTSGAAPYTNTATVTADNPGGFDYVSTNGFFPYVLNQIGPKIKASVPASWDATLDMPLVDDYAVFLSDYSLTMTLPDSLHPATSGGTDMRAATAPILQQIYGQSVTRNSLQQLVDRTGSIATAVRKKKLQDVRDATFAAFPTTTATSARATLSSAIDAIATTYTDPTVTSPAVLPGDASITSATLLADFDASDPSKFTSFLDGQTFNWTDRKNGFQATKANNSGTYSSMPNRRAAKADGTLPGVLFGSANAWILQNVAVGPIVDPLPASTLQSTDASLVAALNAANSAFTFFFVVVPTAKGGDVFSLSSASTNLILVNMQPNGVPRFLRSDTTAGSFFTPTDAGITIGSRYVYAYRCDGAGAITYRRGAVTQTGTTARTGAATGSTFTLGNRGVSGSATLNGEMDELAFFTGAMSDTEMTNVMAGLRSKWNAA